MPKRIALIIGNDQYQDNKLPSLEKPIADAKSLASVLRDPSIGAFDDVNLLLNESARNLQLSISRLFNRKSREDTLLLYFSGHGVRNIDGELFLAAGDTEHDYLEATSIPAAFITRAMNRSYSQRQILVLDCCYSGAFERGSKDAIGSIAGTGITFEGTGYGRVVLTATDAVQRAWENEIIIGEIENSVFTHYLVRGLRMGMADLNQDGKITIDEWYKYTYEQVIMHTVKQTPHKWTYKEQGDILVAKNPYSRETRIKNELPPPQADGVSTTTSEGNPPQSGGVFDPLWNKPKTSSQTNEAKPNDEAVSLNDRKVELKELSKLPEGIAETLTKNEVLINTGAFP